MANYLKDENQLIVWPVWNEATESDSFQGNIGIKIRYDLTNKELLQECLNAWKIDVDKGYCLFLVRAEGKKEISLEDTVKNTGIHNGDFLEIV